VLEVAQQGDRRLRVLGVAEVVGDADAQRDRRDPGAVEALLEDADEPGDALVLRAAEAEAPSAKTRTRTFLPEPWGSGQVPRTIWSDCFGSTPRRKESVTVWSNLVGGMAFSVVMASGSV